jgi:Flp pilus assembly protein TadD
VPTIAQTLSAALQTHQAGNFSQAEQLYQSILEAEPNHAEALHLLGVLAFQRGQFDLAVMRIQRALALNPQAVVYHCNLGLAYQTLGRFEEAVASFRRALQIRSDLPEAHNNLGALLFQRGKVDEAAAHYQEALRLRPAYAEAHNNMGNALQQQGKPREAIACHCEAVRLNPQYAEAFNNIAVALQRLGKLAESVIECQKALGVRPNYPHALNNMGMALRLQGQWDESEALFQKAIQLTTDYPDPHFNLALVKLSRGDFEHGWAEYEWRSAQFHFQRDFTQPRWDGSDLNGRTILLHAEQGLGDTLQFIRYVPVVGQRGEKVLVECQPALVRLLGSVPGIEALVAQGSPLPPFEVQVPLPSLPGILHTSLDTIPDDVPYLQADTRLLRHWRRVLNQSGVRCPVSGVEEGVFDTGLRTPDAGRILRVGIAWQGNPGFLHDGLRSIPLAHFTRLADVSGIQLFSLQKGPGVEQLQALTSDFGLRTSDCLDEESGAFMDTAAVMMNLDLVVSSDTVIPHLAGALGIPVWVALALAPDWRWMLEREDSPWYPTMRLFRQRRQGDWDEVFERIAVELATQVRETNR